jgi:ABC-type glycerol-3-phosphate transport system substrate-binding protein
MKKYKKIVITTLVTVIVLAATLGIVAFAQADDEGTQTARENMYERVAQVYEANTGNAINAAALEAAFNQARQEIATEAKDRMQQKLIEEGKITQQQLDDLKAWLEARPDMTSDEFKQWLESKPEGVPFGLGDRGPALQRGFSRMGKMFRGWCAPDNAE